MRTLTRRGGSARGSGARRTFGVAALSAAVLATLVDPGPAQAATIPTPPAVCHPTSVPGTPAIATFALSPASVDVTKAAKKVTITIIAVDITQDITSMSVAMQSPEIGGVTRSAQANMSLSDGTARNGTWTGTATIPRWTNDGTWKITQVGMLDAGGGFAFYFPTGGPWDMSWPQSFQVTSTHDVRPPTVTAVTLSPTSVNTSAATKRIKATVKVKDDLSGVPSATGVYVIGFVTIGSRMHSISGEYLRRVKGTPKKGTYTGGFNVPRWVGAGTHVWGLALDLADGAGNGADLQAADLKAKHVRSFFKVTSRGDNTKPVLTGLTFAPRSVDARSGDKNVAVTLKASDTRSGLEGVTVQFTSPSGASSAAFASAATNGPALRTFKLTVPIPRCSDPGTWTVSVDLYDVAGNVKHYTTAQVAGKHFHTTLSVKALDTESPAATIPATISPEGSLPVTFSEPTLWKDGTAQTALQVLDHTNFSPIAGTWSCQNAAASPVTCDADGAHVTVATFTPTSALESAHGYLVQTTQPDIFDTSGNQLPTYVADFTTTDVQAAG
jgi:hypothetical protein